MYVYTPSSKVLLQDWGSVFDIMRGEVWSGNLFYVTKKELR